MAKYFIKMFIEILDDPKVQTLPDRLWRRFYELVLLAGRYDDGGNLPDTQAIAWALRQHTDDVALDLQQLTGAKLIRKTETGWLVINYEKRQSPIPGDQRYAEYRKHHPQRGQEKPQTKPQRNANEALLEVEVEEEKEKEVEKEEESEVDHPAASAAQQFLSICREYFLSSFGEKKFKTPAQENAIIALERQYGPGKLKECIDWAAKRGMASGPAIGSIEKAIAKWDDPKPTKQAKQTADYSSWEGEK